MIMYYFYLTVLAVLIFILFEDPNVPRYIELRLKLFRIDIIKYYMKMKMKKQLDRDLREIRKWSKENGKDKM